MTKIRRTLRLSSRHMYIIENQLCNEFNTSVKNAIIAKTIEQYPYMKERLEALEKQCLELLKENKTLKQNIGILLAKRTM